MNRAVGQRYLPIGLTVRHTQNEQPPDNNAQQPQDTRGVSLEIEGVIL